MGILDWIGDKVEGAKDYWDKKISGNYEHFEYCYNCGIRLDTKYGVGENFQCSECRLLLCKKCADEKIITETRILQEPAFFKKGRRQHRFKCPECGYIIYESDVEIFR